MNTVTLTPVLLHTDTKPSIHENPTFLTIVLGISGSTGGNQSLENPRISKGDKQATACSENISQSSSYQTLARRYHLVLAVGAVPPVPSLCLRAQRRPRTPDTSQQKADKTAKASSAFQEPQRLGPNPLQSRGLPHLPSYSKFRKLTITPNATNQQTESRKSVGQWRRLLEKGSSQSIEKSMDRPATASV